MLTFSQFSVPSRCGISYTTATSAPSGLFLCFCPSLNYIVANLYNFVANRLPLFFFFFCCRTSTQKLELDLHTFRRQFKPRHTPVLTSPVRRMNVDTVASVWPVQVHLSDVVAVADMIMVTERTEPLRRCFLIPYDSERGKKHRRQIRGKEAQTPSAYK